MEDRLDIKTAQNVTIELALAGGGKRVMSMLLDLLVVGVYVFVVLYILLSFAGNMFGHSLFFYKVLSAIFVLPALTYSLWTEYFFNGQSVGKKITSIRVVQLNGQKATFSEYFTRWVFRMVDIWSFMFLGIYFDAFLPSELAVGLISLSFFATGMVAVLTISQTKNSQRLGDYFAGTTVIEVKEYLNIRDTILREVDDKYIATYQEVIKLTDNDARIILDTYDKAIKNSDYSLLKRLREKITETIGVENNLGDKEYVQKIIKDFNSITQKM